MITRATLIGTLLIACGTSEGTKAAAPVKPRQPPPPAAAPAEPSPAPASLQPTDPNAPRDKPVRTSSPAEMEAMERAIAPYSKRDRALYPDAKRRFLAGLPPGHAFAVVTNLHSPGQEEMVFVLVQRIEGDQITGRIVSDILGVTGYKAGDTYTLSERDLIDWVITRPDGSEEGNLVGKFLDTWQGPTRP
jgi:hypothetical protein